MERGQGRRQQEREQTFPLAIVEGLREGDDLALMCWKGESGDQTAEVIDRADRKRNPRP
jgi:hypothetical protein